MKVTILSTMLADEGIGEWGFSALVEADGRRILVHVVHDEDTARQPGQRLLHRLPIERMA